MKAGPEFAISYRLEPFARTATDVSPYLASDGWLRIAVSGKELCQTTGGLSVRDNLFPYAAWFADSLPALLGDDPFPLGVAARSGADFERLGAASLKRLRSLERLESASERFGDWVSRHALRAASDGGEPPNVFFRRSGDRIEVSWDNARLSGAAGFLRRSGAARIGLRSFADAVDGFVRSLLSDLRQRHPALREDPEILGVLSRLDAQPRLP